MYYNWTWILLCIPSHRCTDMRKFQNSTFLYPVLRHICLGPLNYYKNIDILSHHRLVSLYNPIQKYRIQFVRTFTFILVNNLTYLFFNDTITFTLHVLLYTDNFLFFESKCFVVLKNAHLWVTPELNYYLKNVISKKWKKPVLNL